MPYILKWPAGIIFLLFQFSHDRKPYNCFSFFLFLHLVRIYEPHISIHTYTKTLCKGILHAYVDLHFSSLSFRQALAPEMVPSTQYAMASSVKVRKTALGMVTYRSSEAKSPAKGTSSGHLFLEEHCPWFLSRSIWTVHLFSKIIWFLSWILCDSAEGWWIWMNPL